MCVRVSPSVRAINTVASVRLNHAAPLSRVNTRVNGKGGSSAVSVFPVGPRILNNNDFLMWNCDYIVTVRYGSS